MPPNGAPGLEHLTDVGRTVQAFYEVNPFPAFEISKYRTRDDIRERASPYVKLLDRQLPHTASILDVGCGTGQLVNFLALREQRQVTGVDFSAVSLGYARSLKEKFSMENLTLLQDDVLALSVPSNQFDYVFCNGVLHHTGNAKLGFSQVVQTAKPGGYVTVGLYNNYGRVVHSAVRWLSLHSGPLSQPIADWGVRRMLGEQFEAFDIEKKRTWWADQFTHPHETSHSANEVLGWFEELGLDYAASLPPIELGGDEAHVILFPRQTSRPNTFGRNLSAILRQLQWVWQLRWTGGYFLMVGRKRDTSPAAAVSGGPDPLASAGTP